MPRLVRKPPPDLPRITLQVGALQRNYLLSAPLGPRSAPRPLVVVYHGGGGTPEIALHATEILDKSAARGFVVALPEAVRPDGAQPPHFLRNPAFWNAGLPRGFVWKRQIDDLAFTGALLDDVAARVPIDAARVFAMGFSNGAAMALRVGVELSERFAAVAGVAGHLWVRDRAPRRPISMLYMTGTADPLNPIDGGRFTTPWGTEEEKEPIWGFLHDWAAWIGAPPQAETIRNHAGIRMLRHRAEHGDREVLVYLLEGVGHVWPGGPPVLNERWTGPTTTKLHATDVILAFFERIGKWEGGKVGT